MRISEVSKSFGGLLALDRVNLEIPEAQIKGLIGPNGAGKTTLMNIVSRFISADSGRVEFMGQDLSRHSAHKLARMGIGRTFQIAQTAGHVTVLDLVMVGLHAVTRRGMVHGICKTPWEREEERWIRERADEAIELIGLGHLRNVPASILASGDRKLVELAKALAADPKLLLLDEPAAGMSPAEVESLALMLQRLRERKITVLLVEHNVPLVMEVADDVCVLDFGQVIADGRPQEVIKNPRVVKAYLGEE